MTRISERKTKARMETNAMRQGRAVIIEPEAHELIVRLKGKRFRYAVPYLAILDLGAKILANERRLEKMEKKRGGRLTQ